MAIAKSKFLAVVMLSFMSIVSTPSQAVFCANCATEWTQLFNNFELMTTASNSVKQVAQQVESYTLQYKQYMVQYNQMKGLASDVFDAQRQAIQEKINTYNVLKYDLEKLYGTMQSARDMMDQRYKEIAASGLTYDQYMERDKHLSETSQGRYKTLADDAISSLKSIDDDYKRVQAIQDRIPVSEGIHQAMLNMNDQMSVMTNQSIETRKMLAQQQLTRANEKNEESANLDAAKSELDKSRTEKNDMLKKMRDSIKTMQQKYAK